MRKELPKNNYQNKRQNCRKLAQITILKFTRDL